MTSPTEGKVAIRDDDVKNLGKLNLVVTNPNKDTFRATVEVIAAVRPVVSSTEPKELTTASPRSLTIIGQGFQAGCTATINDDPRTVAPGGSDKKITIALLDKDLVVGTLKLIVKNPGPDGHASEVGSITVK